MTDYLGLTYYTEKLTFKEYDESDKTYVKHLEIIIPEANDVYGFSGVLVTYRCPHYRENYNVFANNFLANAKEMDVETANFINENYRELLAR